MVQVRVEKKGEEPTLRLLLAWRVEDTADDEAAAAWDVADGAVEDISYSLVEKCNSNSNTPIADNCLFRKYFRDKCTACLYFRLGCTFFPD